MVHWRQRCNNWGSTKCDGRRMLLRPGMGNTSDLPRTLHNERVDTAQEQIQTTHNVRPCEQWQRMRSSETAPSGQGEHTELFCATATVEGGHCEHTVAPGDCVTKPGKHGFCEVAPCALTKKPLSLGKHTLEPAWAVKNLHHNTRPISQCACKTKTGLPCLALRTVCLSWYVVCASRATV